MASQNCAARSRETERSRRKACGNVVSEADFFFEEKIRDQNEALSRRSPREPKPLSSDEEDIVVCEE